MAQKNNIRSIRFSDELAELIDRQVGRTFTEKFENLVTRCVWELPGKEAELERLNKEIEKKKKEYTRLMEIITKQQYSVQEIDRSLRGLQGAISRERAKWEM